MKAGPVSRAQRKARQCRELPGLDGEPGRHRVAAALLEDAGLARRDHRGPQIVARPRAARALADPAIQAHHHRRAGEPLGEPGGDDAENAGMPALAGGDQHRQIVPDLLFDRAEGSIERAPLHRLPLGVELVQPGRDLLDAERIVRGEQLGTQPALAHPAAGIDLGPSMKPSLRASSIASMPAIRASARSPGLPPCRATFSPWTTKARLRPKAAPHRRPCRAPRGRAPPGGRA